MPRNKWFSDHDEGLIEHGRGYGGIEPKHHSTYEKRVSKKVNQNLSQVLRLFPDLVEYVDEGTQEQIEDRTDPYLIGRKLAELYPDETTEIIMGLAMGDARRNEGIDELEYDDYGEYRKELDEYLDDLEDDLDLIRMTEAYRHHKTKLMSPFYNKLITAVEDRVKKTDVKIEIVPADVLRTDEVWSEDFTILKLRDTRDASGIDEFFDGFLDFMDETTTFEKPESLEEDLSPEVLEELYSTYREVLDRLDHEFERVVKEYWDVNRVVGRDRLLRKAVDTLDELNKHQEEILTEYHDEEPRQEGDIDIEGVLKTEPVRGNRTESWTGYKTRNANLMVDDFEPPLLERREKGNSEKVYDATGFGRFVMFIYCLGDYSKGGKYRVERGFPPRLSRKTPVWLERALDEIET